MLSTATLALREWRVRHQTLLNGRFSDLSMVETNRNSAELRLDCDSCLISICVWDHRHCMDIEVLDTSTGKSRIPTAGPSRSMDDLLTRLDHFANWIEANIPATGR